MKNGQKNTAGKTGPERNALGQVFGGNPGNRGGSGRPPSKIRAAMRESLDARIVIAEAIADDGDASPADRLRALDLLAKYGLGTTTTSTDVDGNDAIKAGRLTPEQRKQTIARLLTETRN